MHKEVHKHMHMHTHTHTRTHTHTHTHTHTQTHTHTHTHAYAHVHAQTNHAHTNQKIHIHTHTFTHTRIQTHTHTHTHTIALLLFWDSKTAPSSRGPIAQNWLSHTYVHQQQPPDPSSNCLPLPRQYSKDTRTRDVVSRHALQPEVIVGYQYFWTPKVPKQNCRNETGKKTDLHEI